MKNLLSVLFLAAGLILMGYIARASDQASAEWKCLPGADQRLDADGLCGNPDDRESPALSEGSLLLLLPRQGNQPTRRITGDHAGQSNDSEKRTIVYFFWGAGCPHCEEEKEFLRGLKRAQTSVEIREYEVWHHTENAALMARMLRAYGVQSSGVPVTIVHDRLFSGFTAQTRASIEKAVEACRIDPCDDPAETLTGLGGTDQGTRPVPPVSGTSAAAGETGTGTSVTMPLMGTFDTRNSSLPVLTLVIAGMDSFNPCAFFVLLSLLGILVHAGSRDKMLLIGGVFVFFSGLIYFLVMAAWLNLFLVMGHVAVITTIAGGVSLVIAGINIKDFFLFKRGLSLTIPEGAKPKLFDRMRKLLRSTSLLSILIGATVLAVVANLYELLCTAGFPMVFTRILTLHNLSTATYYLYLLLYTVIYVVPLFILVLGFTLTLGKRQLTEWQGRILKLLSGTMMLGLGGVLLVRPESLNSVLVSFTILVSALGVSMLVAMVTRRVGG